MSGECACGHDITKHEPAPDEWEPVGACQACDCREFWATES